MRVLLEVGRGGVDQLVRVFGLVGRLHGVGILLVARARAGRAAEQRERECDVEFRDCEMIHHGTKDRLFGPFLFSHGEA